MNTSSLQQFLQGDGSWIITAVAILLAIKAWKNSSWLQLFSVIGFWGIIMSMTKG
ncbi:TcpD family membrane protein, partial [Streptococcus suis]